MMFTLTHCTINRIHHNGFTTTGKAQNHPPSKLQIRLLI